MAAVLYADGTIRQKFEGEFKMVYWESPSSMDSADTVTPTAITGRTIRVLQAWDHTTGDAVTATVSSGVVTLDAAGGTTNKVYGLWFIYI